jgi:uncharacterized protein YsxB (DUF464 family)
MININFIPDKYTVCITGHAEYDEKGKDIVCAAISTLFYTLAESLYDVAHMLDGDMQFSDKEGNGYLKVRPKKEFEANVSLIYWTVLKGFELVAKTYKENVTLRVGGLENPETNNL